MLLPFKSSAFTSIGPDSDPFDKMRGRSLLVPRAPECTFFGYSTKNNLQASMESQSIT